MPLKERKAIKDLRSNSDVVIKKADKGTTTVIMNTKDKLQEGQVLLDDKNNYRPVTTPMAKETARKTRVIINDLHQGNHIDTMTKNWLLQTPNPPRIPVFYTLTKIHKPTLPGRPIILGCDGLTERISSFLDHILQPIAQAQKSYLKDTTQFINFIEKRIVPKNTILVSMDVNSLYTNIPQEEEINESFYKNDTPIPTHSLTSSVTKTYTSGKFFPVQRKKLSKDSRHCDGDQSCSLFRQHAMERYTLFTYGRQPGTSARPNMELRRFGIKICFRGNFDHFDQVTGQLTLKLSLI